jgi:hypothetical protein
VKNVPANLLYFDMHSLSAKWCFANGPRGKITLLVARQVFGVKEVSGLINPQVFKEQEIDFAHSYTVLPKAN